MTKIRKTANCENNWKNKIEFSTNCKKGNKNCWKDNTSKAKNWLMLNHNPSWLAAVALPMTKLKQDCCN